jgi:hypothetical protein
MWLTVLPEVAPSDPRRRGYGWVWKPPVTGGVGGMRCIDCGSVAITGRSERSAQGYRRSLMILWGWVAHRSAGARERLSYQTANFMSSPRGADRVSKGRAMRRRKLKWLWKWLRELAVMKIMKISREEMLNEAGAARSRAPTAWRLVEIDMDRAWWNFQGLLSSAWPAESPLYGRCHAGSRGRRARRRPAK